MACTDHPELIDFLTNFDGKAPFDLIYCSYTDTVSAAIFGLFVFGTLGLMYYLSDDSVAVPVVLAVMLGSIAMAALPAIAVRIATIMFVFGATAAVLYLVHRVRPLR